MPGMPQHAVFTNEIRVKILLLAGLNPAPNLQIETSLRPIYQEHSLHRSCYPSEFIGWSGI